MRNRYNRDEEIVSFLPKMNGSGVVASELLANQPDKCGYLNKKNDSFFSRIFPCFTTKWKKRYFILIGNFLFRFTSEEGTKPKGVPLPLDACSVSLSDFDTDENCFLVKTTRKMYVLQATSKILAKEWIQAINKRKAAAVRENLGHSHSSNEVKSINNVGSKLFTERLEKDRTGDTSTSVLNPLYSSQPGLP